MKKIISIVLLFIAAVAMILMCAENSDGSFNFWWTVGWMTVSFIAVKIWEKLNPEESKNDGNN